MIAPARTLIISPHTDDAEVSSGGTISRFLREGREVFVLVLSRAFARDAEAPLEECRRALGSFGLDVGHIFLRDFPVRRLTEHRQAILDLLLQAKRLLEPELVLMPSLNDIHQDHQVAAQEGIRAFKDRCILGYEYPWNHLEFHTTAFIKLEAEDVERKIRAIAEYKSQQRPYMQPDLIRAWALTRGIAVGHQYAESFEVVRWVS